MEFDPSILSADDRFIALAYLDPFCALPFPDLVLAPEGEPYLYRWYLSPRTLYNGDRAPAEIMFHIQVMSDPERPLHDHPWDNQSVILAGGYDEEICDPRLSMEPFRWHRSVGDVICRRAEVAHRLILPKKIPYTMTLFTTGPKRREWGFWYPEGWIHNEKVVHNDGNVSTHGEQM
jgi:hypothetical protein